MGKKISVKLNVDKDNLQKMWDYLGQMTQPMCSHKP